MKRFLGWLIVLVGLSGSVQAAADVDGDVFYDAQEPEYTIIFADGRTGMYPAGFAKQLVVVQAADQVGLESDNTVDFSRTPSLTKRDFDTVMTMIIDPTFKPCTTDDLLGAILAADFMLDQDHFLQEKLAELLFTEYRPLKKPNALISKMANKHAAILIKKIKEYAGKSRVAMGYPKLTQRVQLFIGSSNPEGKDLFPVPDYTTGKPTLKPFPISVQDLIDTQSIPAVSMRQYYDGTQRLELDLSNQGLTSLKGLNNVPNIKSAIALNIDKNNLATIIKNTFVNLPSVKNISLAENSITSIEAGAFNNLPALKEVNLNAYVEFGQYAYGSLQNLKTLSLSCFVNTPSLEEIDAVGTILPFDLKDPQIRELKKKYRLTTRMGMFNPWQVYVMSLETGDSVMATTCNGYVDPTNMNQLIIPKGGYLDEDAGYLFVPHFTRTVIDTKADVSFVATPENGYLDPETDAFIVPEGGTIEYGVLYLPGYVRVVQRGTGDSIIATVQNRYLDPETHELIIPKGGQLSEDGKTLEVQYLYQF